MSSFFNFQFLSNFVCPRKILDLHCVWTCANFHIAGEKKSLEAKRLNLSPWTVHAFFQSEKAYPKGVKWTLLISK